MEQKRTMLIVDDSKINRHLLQAVFRKDYSIIEADDGDVALDILEEKSLEISIVLLDLTMPRVSGYEVVTAMREKLGLDSTPVIVITAADEKESEIKALEMGANDFITKPIDITILKKRVKVLVEREELEKVRLNQILLEEQLLHQKQLNSLLNKVPGGVGIFELTMDKSLKMIDCNSGLLKLFGYDENQKEILIKSNIIDFINPENVSELIRLTEMSMSTLKPFNYTLQVKKADGQYLWVMVSDSAIRVEDGSTQFYTLVVDASEEERIKAELSYRAEFDQLTGIYNKHAFYKATERILRDNPDTVFALICFNIEHFNLVNDLMGHDFGDKVLKEFASALAEKNRHIGTYCRLESDHFAICIPLSKMNMDVYGRISAGLFKSLGMTNKIVIGAGVYKITDRSISVDQMCDRANIALQTVKGNYVNNYAFYDDDMRKAMLVEQEIRDNMVNALEEGQFKIYLQPVHSLSADTTVSAEVLVRWMHPVKGMISPGVFIPVFEKSGFIAKLDYYVWEQTCRYLKERHDKGLPEISVSVNCSRMSMYDPNLCDKIVGLTRKYNINPKLFKVEITESAYSDNPEQLLSTIKALQQYGFLILMDDFGSGYSSLNTLKDIPVDILKIDMKFLKGLETSQRATSIIMSVVLMAKWLRIPTIAEGVETKAQLDFMRSIGCDRIQGYYYSKPLPPEEFEKYISESNTPVMAPPSDETISSEDFEMLFSGNNLVSKLMSTSFGAIGFYRIIDGNLEIIRANERYYEIMGTTPEEMLGTRDVIENHIHSEDRHIVREACKNAMDTGKSINKIFRGIGGKDKDIMWIDSICRYIGGGKESPYFCISFNDITSEVDKENQLSAITNIMPGGIAIFDINDKIHATYTNPGCYALVDYTEEEFKKAGFKDNIKEIIHPDDRPRLINELSKVNKTGEMLSCDFRVKKKDGSYTWIHLNSTSLSQPGAKVQRILAILTDISAQKKSEQQIREIMDLIPGAIFRYCHEDGVIDYMSNTFHSLLGYSMDEFIEMCSNNFYNVIYEKDRKRIYDEVSEMIASGIIHQCEYRALCKCGEIIWMKGIATMTVDADGKHWFTVIILNSTEKTEKYGKQGKEDMQQ